MKEITNILKLAPSKIRQYGFVINMNVAVSSSSSSIFDRLEDFDQYLSESHRVYLPLNNHPRFRFVEVMARSIHGFENR